VAKKTRTPPPPRRPVQAPKQRTGDNRGRSGMSAADERRSRIILYALAGSGVLALAIVLALVFLRNGDNSAKAGNLPTVMAAAGCTYKEYPNAGRNHLSDINAKPPKQWNSFPPTSGPHYFQPAIFNQYDQPIVELQAVHNLEHGGVIIQYGAGVPQSAIDKITTFYRADPNAMIVAPLPSLKKKIALSSWRHLSTCTAFNEKAFTSFRDTLRYHGPERFPASSLQPGM
jgi:hypothetical protein